MIKWLKMEWSKVDGLVVVDVVHELDGFRIDQKGVAKAF